MPQVQGCKEWNWSYKILGRPKKMSDVPDLFGLARTVLSMLRIQASNKAT